MTLEPSQIERISRALLPCPVCGGVEGCDHSITERLREAICLLNPITVSAPSPATAAVEPSEAANLTQTGDSIMHQCCYIEGGKEDGIPCSGEASHVITYSPFGPDDYTESCVEHLGEMITDAREHHVTRLRAERQKP